MYDEAFSFRFHFKDGQVTYQNKFLQSRSYLKDTQAQRIVVNYFGTRAHPDPCKTILQKWVSYSHAPVLPKLVSEWRGKTVHSGEARQGYTEPKKVVVL